MTTPERIQLHHRSGRLGHAVSLHEAAAQQGDRPVDKSVKRERRYVRHEVTVEDVASGKLYFRETRDIMSR